MKNRPFYKLNYEHYSVYWNIISPANWKNYPVNAQAKAAREMEIALNAN